MNLEEFIAVSKLPGVYKIVSNRDNGLFIEDMDTGKKKFASMRKHMFTPLASVSIYTDDDSTELSTIFQTMMEKSGELDPKEALSSNQALFDYFEKILPNYDRDKVFIGDIKKVIKWYNFLNERKMLTTATDEEE